MYNYVDLPAGM